MPHNTFKTLKEFKVGSKSGQYYSLPALGKALGVAVERLPVSLRIVLESVLRNCDGKKVTEEHIKQLANWKPNAKREEEIPFVVARVVLQDFTASPCWPTLPPCATSPPSSTRIPRPSNPSFRWTSSSTIPS